MTTPYTGRFAPSPTGPMHFGTLIAAVVSYLQARANDGTWLLRMEDVDVLRKVEGSDRQIISSLETFGFEWDGDIVYQTDRTAAYEQALAKLKHKHLVFPCTCSRKQLAQQTGEWSPVYPGTCSQSTQWQDEHYAIRIRTVDESICFDDAVYGEQQQNIAQDVGDFVIKRRDRLFAYQLAVVVDDAWQGITEVVRGTDLLDSTARQIYLQRCLGVDTPAYFHFPVAVDEVGNKLSKSTDSTNIDATEPVIALNRVLQFLGQQQVDTHDVSEFWRQAIKQWHSGLIPRQTTIRV